MNLGDEGNSLKIARYPYEKWLMIRWLWEEERSWVFLNSRTSLLCIRGRLGL